MSKTGNIILNGCLAMIANILRRTSTVSLPVIVRGDEAYVQLVGLLGSGRRRPVRRDKFRRQQTCIRGYIAMLMDLSLLDALRKLLRDFIQPTIEIPPVAHVAT